MPHQRFQSYRFLCRGTSVLPFYRLTITLYPVPYIISQNLPCPLSYPTPLPSRYQVRIPLCLYIVYASTHPYLPTKVLYITSIRAHICVLTNPRLARPLPRKCLRTALWGLPTTYSFLGIYPNLCIPPCGYLPKHESKPSSTLARIPLRA